MSSTIGKYGDIRHILRHSYRTKDYHDLTFICNDGQLRCHRLIIAALSPYIHRVLAENPNQDPIAYICLPYVQIEHLSAVIKFFYTGKFILRYNLIEIIKSLLKEVFLIDAALVLPSMPHSETTSSCFGHNPAQPAFFVGGRDRPK